MRKFALPLARLCTAMWVGAALLFVTTSVIEQVHPSFDTTTKDTLALIRFPWYYGTGATLLGLGLVAALLVGRRDRMVSVAAGLVAVALAVMAADYLLVYAPLRDMLSPPGSVRTDSFRSLHRWSEWANTAGFLLAAAAAVLLCVAERRDDRTV